MATTYNNLYLDTRTRLKKAGIEGGQLEARELICYAADKSREQFYRDMHLYASGELEKRVDALVQRRLGGEPVAYIVGEWEFYGLPLNVSSEVLIPRIDTEVLAERGILKARAAGEGARVLDLCAGSGCVGLAIAANAPGCRVVLGELTAEQACHNIGTAAVAMIKKYMRTVQPAKGSITLASAPGKTTPLVQTGRLRDSITYEVRGL